MPSNFRWRENGDSREDELALAVGPCAEEVDDHNDGETHRYPCRIVDRLVPEVNQDRGSAKFGGQNDRPVVPVIPTLSSPIPAKPSAGAACGVIHVVRTMVNENAGSTKRSASLIWPPGRGR